MIEETINLPRTWEMYAHRMKRNDPVKGEETFHMNFGDERWVKFHGLPYPIVRVTLTEDSEGEYLGWLPAEKDVPRMLQPAKLFNMQFPYGSKVEEESGRGEVLRLRAEEVPS